MSRFAFAAMRAALAVTLVALPAVPALAASADLAPGSTGPAVLQLQLSLYDAGANVPLTASLGPATASADAKLGIDPTATLKLGQSGPAVTSLQRALTQAGFPIEATGRFGPLTESTVNRFLQAHRQPADNQVELAEVVAATPLYTILGDLDGLIGLPYAWGGTSPQTGFDCSGLVVYVYSQVGVALSHSTYAQWDSGTPVAPGTLQPGDLVFFSASGPGPSHVGIYVGDDEFIQAASPATGVVLSNLTHPYWMSTYIGARRLL